jgi:hypothetical protein
MNMNTVNPAVNLDGPSESSQLRRNLRQWWTVITILLAATFFMEPVFAGAPAVSLRCAQWRRRYDRRS